MNRVSHDKQDGGPPVDEPKKFLTTGGFRKVFHLGYDGIDHAASEFFVYDIAGNSTQPFCQHTIWR